MASEDSRQDCELEIARTVNEMYRSVYMLQDISNDCPEFLEANLPDLLEVQKRVANIINKIDELA